MFVSLWDKSLVLTVLVFRTCVRQLGTHHRRFYERHSMMDHSELKSDRRSWPGSPELTRILFPSTYCDDIFVRRSVMRYTVCEVVPWRNLRVSLFAMFVIVSMVPVLTGSRHSAITGSVSECRLKRVVHVLRFPGCIRHSVPSFACVGTCPSYVRLVELEPNIVHIERSCKCCQEVGERVASVVLKCPGRARYLQVKIAAPRRCMCRPCVNGYLSALEITPAGGLWWV